jgi:isochorismate hydrolase
MKENYFENIGKKSEELLGKIFPVPHYRKKSFDINESALIVTDMQEYFTNENSHAYIPASDAIIKPISDLISFFKKKKRSIIFTRHINTKEDAGMLSVWWSDIITEGNYSELTDKLDAKGSEIFNKTQYDAFYNTGIEEYLNSKGIKNIIITGVTTHLCCETTARSAFVRGFEVYFPVDCTATYDEEFHLSSLRNLSHGFAHIIKSSDLIKQAGGNE